MPPQTEEKPSQNPVFLAACAGAATLGITASYLLYLWSAKPSSEFPMREGYEPILGHTRSTKQHINQLQHFRLEQALKLQTDIMVETYPYPAGQLHIIMDPEIVRYVHEEHFDHISRGGRNSEQGRELFGDGIFNANKENWRKHRKIASRLLTMRNLKYSMFENFVDVSKRLCDKLALLNQQGKPIDLGDLFLRMTMDGFVTSAFGIVSNNIEDDNATDFAQAFTRGFQLLAERFTTRPWWKIQRFFNIGGEREMKKVVQFVRGFCNNIVQMNQERREKGEIDERADLLSIFVKDYENITDELIKDVCMNFIIAGRDTTGSLLAWFVYEMMENPEIYQRVMQEIESIDEMTYDAVNQMKFTESCLLETLRLHSIVPLNNTMNVEKEIVLPDGRVIPENSRIAVGSFIMGRLPNLHEKPLEFNPDRFADGLKSMHPTLFPHFSVAPRICLGRNVSLMEAKTCVWHLYRKFRVEKTFDGPLKSEGASLLFAKDFFVRVIER